MNFRKGRPKMRFDKRNKSKRNGQTRMKKARDNTKRNKKAKMKKTRNERQGKEKQEIKS